MIKNEIQFNITSKKLEGFKRALQILKDKSNVDFDLKQIQLDAIQSEVEILEDEIKEYQSLRDNEVVFVSIDNILNLPIVLIKARISKGWSHLELANKLDLKEQQIQRYEAQNYENASFTKLIIIANALGVEFNPVKARLNSFEFNLPIGITQEQVSAEQFRLRRERTLLV